MNESCPHAGVVGERALRALLDRTGAVVVAVDPDLRVTYANGPAAAAAGRPAEDLLTLPLRDTGIFGTATDAVEAFVGRALSPGGETSARVERPRAGATPEVHELQAVVERDPSGVATSVLVQARDVTDRRRAEHDEFRALADNSPDNILRYDLEGRVTYSNRDFEHRVRITPGGTLGRTTTELAGDRSSGIAEYERLLQRALRTGEPGVVELHVHHPVTGDARVHQVAIAPERDGCGVIRGAIAVGRDVTEEVRVRQALTEKEREFRTLAENAGDHIVRWDTGLRMRYVNPAMLRLMAIPPERVLGRTTRELAPDDRFQEVEDAIRRVIASGVSTTIELRFRNPADDVEQVHEILLVPERDDDEHVRSVLGIGRDVTHKIAQMDVIESLLRTDSLTNLANRQALRERAPGMFAGASRRRMQVGVMVLDLDRFKSVNDGLGHSAGDELLREVARRLGACLRPDDLLVRLGGDEFVIVTPDIQDTPDVAAIAERLHAALAAPLELRSRAVPVSASIGVAVYPGDGLGLEELLAHADSAMYHAKRSGRARTEYYRAELSEAVRRRLMIEESLRDACDGAGLELYAQPQVALDAPHTPLGAELLLRWNHPELGFLTPDAFIGIAEETGMIIPIGRWVLEEAARLAVRWNAGRDRPLSVAVNVSTRQFHDDLPAVLDAVLARTGCECAWLAIEITESALLEDSAVVQRTLDAFRSRGIRVALDDFGTGYSALNYLARFPVDCLKIDRSFVEGIGRSERDDELVKAFIAMASALHLGVVAAEFLLAHGCPTAQGYLFGPPMTIHRFEQRFLGAPPDAAAPGIRRVAAPDQPSARTTSA